MPVMARRSFVITDKDGKSIVLTENDKIQEDVETQVTCGSSRCHSRHGKQVVIEWSSIGIQKNPDLIPDAFFRMIEMALDPSDPKKREVFCSATCAKDFLTYDYVAPLSPREKAVQEMNNQQVAEKKNKPAVVVDFKPMPPLDTEQEENPEPMGLGDIDPSKVTADPEAL